MYPYTHLPTPLSPQKFYILLAITRHELHGYAVRGLAANNSLGGIKMSDGTLYTLLKRMINEGLIEEAGLQPAGKSATMRLHYRITQEGKLRLKEELKRLKHAVEIGENLGYFDDETPPEIQRLLDSLKA